MTKNTTRKGLALGAAFALVGSALVGLPAQAAGEISLAVTSGTGNGSVLGDSFSVKATVGSLVPSSSNDQVRFAVTNAAKETLTLTVDGGTVGSGTHSEGTQVVGDTANYAASDTSAADAFTVLGNNFTTSGAVVGTVAMTYDRNQTLVLGTGAAASHDVVVTAFLDADNDGVLDAGEYASAPVTVSFVKASEVTWSAAFQAAPALADATIKGIVSNDKNINIAQFDGGVELGLATLAGTTYTTLAGSSTTQSTGTFTVGDAVDADGKVTVTPTSALVAGTYVAVAIGGTANAEISAETLSVVGAATLLDFKTEALTTDANVKEATASTAYTVRTGTTALTYTAQASSDDAGTKAAAAGISVTATITKVKMASGSSISAGGKTLAAAGTSIAVTTTTDAAGKISLPITTSGLVTTDKFTVVLTSQGETGATTTVTVADTAATSFAGLNLIGGSAVLKVASGSSYALSYAALDNFGQKLVGNYRVVLIESGATVATTASLVDGVATFTLTDSSTVTESYSADLKVFNGGTGVYDDAGLAAVTDTPVVGSSNAAATVTLTGTDNWTTGTALALNLKDLGTADTRLGQTASTIVPDGSTDNAANNVVVLAGQVSDVSGVSAYSTVTLSAPGVMFVSGTVSSLGSITVQTSATGAYGSVAAYSNTSGDVTVTATAGSASKTLDLSFAAAGALTGTALTVNVVDAAPGKTMTVSGALTDKYGNAVATNAAKLKVTYTGPGFVVGSIPTATQTDGSYEFKVLLGSNDTISGSVVVAYAGADNNFTTGTTSDDLSVSATLAPAPAVVVVTEKVNAGAFNGYVAVYALGHKGSTISWKIAGKWFKTTVTSDYQVFQRKTAAVGVDVNVDIYIDSVKELSKVVATR